MMCAALIAQIKRIEVAGAKVADHVYAVKTQQRRVESAIPVF
jgi:hypothetical protein